MKFTEIKIVEGYLLEPIFWPGQEIMLLGNDMQNLIETGEHLYMHDAVFTTWKNRYEYQRSTAQDWSNKF